MSSKPLHHQHRVEACRAPTVAKIEALRAKEDAAYELLCASLQAQIDGATAEIAQLEARSATATGRLKAQIKARLEMLKAKRDRAYEQLHASLQAQIERIAAEIRRLEGQAAPTTGDIRATLAERLAALKAKRDGAQR